MTYDRPDVERLGALIRALRQERGMTQKQLAERVGWMQARISGLENGRHGMPTLSVMARLASALSVPTAVLLQATGFIEDAPGAEAEPHMSPTLDGAMPEPAERYLSVLEQVLMIEDADLARMLGQTCNRLAKAMDTDKVDIFLYQAEGASLLAVATSATAMGQRQREIGMDRLPVVNGGRAVRAYLSGQTIVTGRAHKGEPEPRGITEGLGIHSMILVPLRIDGQCRGTLSAASGDEDKYSEHDVRLLESIGRWLSLVLHRDELLSTIGS